MLSYPNFPILSFTIAIHFESIHFESHHFEKNVIDSRAASTNGNLYYIYIYICHYLSYLDATAEELTSRDNICVICLEVMTTNAKKLSCNHIFHSSCIRSWFLRQQTCPTCHMDVLQPQQPRSAGKAMPGPRQGLAHYRIKISCKHVI